MTSTPDIIKKLAELIALDEAATPAPWFRLEPPWLPSGARTSVLADSNDPHVARLVCDFEDFADVNGENQTDDWSDAALIVALRNSIPTLKEAVKVIERQREALEKCKLALGLGDETHARHNLEGAIADVANKGDDKVLHRTLCRVSGQLFAIETNVKFGLSGSHDHAE